MPIQLESSGMPRPLAQVTRSHEVGENAPTTSSTSAPAPAAPAARFETGPSVVVTNTPEPTEPYELLPPPPEEVVARHVQERALSHLAALANDETSWHEALSASMGGDYDRVAAAKIRQGIREGESEGVLPELHWVDRASLDGRSSLLDVATGRVLLSDELVAEPDRAVALFTEEIARHIGASVNARGTEGTLASSFRAHADPNVDARFERYRHREAADLSQVPLGLQGIPYGTRVEAPLIVDEKQPPYIRGAHGTGPRVAELREAGAANFLTKAWMDEVADAVQRNGGLGDAENGFLAFSKDHGWVRLRNDNLSPVQNRRLAAISLQTGWPIEDMPSRETKNSVDQENIQRWVTTFFERFDTEFEAFRNDPKDGIAFKDGSRRYELKYDEQAGRFVSFNYKKSGGIRGWVQKHAKWMGPVLDGISVVANVVPGLGQAVALGAQALKTAASWIATGKVKAQQLVATVGSYLLPGAVARFGQARALAGYGAARAAAEAIDTGKVSATSLAGAVTPWIPGLTGSSLADQLLENGIELTARAIDTGEIRPADVLLALAPLETELSPDVWRTILSACKALEDGKLDAEDLAVVLDPLLDRIATGKEERSLLKRGLKIILTGIEERTFPAQELLQALGKELLERLKREFSSKVA